MSLYFCEGISVNNNNEVLFNYNKDYYEDILYLTTPTSGTEIINGVNVYYAYKFNDNSDFQKRKVVRDYIKKNINNNTPTNSEVDELIENGVLTFNQKYKLNNYSVIVSIESSTYIMNTTEMIGYYLGAYGDNISYDYSFKLVKQMYDNVKFDEERAREVLRQHGKNKFMEDKLIYNIKTNFSRLKEQGQLFQLKRFLPAYIRESFSNFLKFKTIQDEETYKNLQGVKILIYDDFLTSGTTLKEMVRYLTSINDKNEITAFVLIKQ